MFLGKLSPSFNLVRFPVFERGVWLCSDSASGEPEERLRLVLGYRTSLREMVNALKECTPDVKAMNLRAIINYLTFMAVHEPALQRDILRIAGHQIISLLGEKSCGLPTDEIFRAKATIMRIQENTKWFDPRDQGTFATRKISVISLCYLQDINLYCIISAALEI